MLSICTFANIEPAVIVFAFTAPEVFAAVYAVFAVGTFFGIRKNFRSLAGLFPDVLVAFFWPIAAVALLAGFIQSKVQVKQ